MAAYTKNKYDSYIVWLFAQRKEHLIPKEISKNIPASTASTWRTTDYSQYIGWEMQQQQREMLEYYELFEKYNRLKCLVTILTKVWVKSSELISSSVSKSTEYQKLMTDNTQLLFTVLPKKFVFRLLSISSSSFYHWISLEKVKCGISPLSLCFKRHPLQLSQSEAATIKELFEQPEFECWPSSSIYYHALRTGKLSISLSTFYQYVNLLGLKRKWRKSSLETYNPIKTSKPNEYIHIDTTFWPFPSGVKAAIVLVSDNFSKALLGWNISLKKDGENARAALHKAIKTIRVHHPSLEYTTLIADGGGENHNMLIEQYINELELPELEKLVAQKDVKFSNSAIESINKIIKRYLRKKLPNSLDALITCLEEIIHDYNCIRPHGSLHGLTPHESYTNQDVKIQQKHCKMKARAMRINENKAINCGVC